MRRVAAVGVRLATRHAKWTGERTITVEVWDVEPFCVLPDVAAA